MKKYINIWTSSSLLLLTLFALFLVINRESEPVDETNAETLYQEESRISPKRSATIRQIDIEDPENIQNLLDSLAQIYIGDSVE